MHKKRLVIGMKRANVAKMVEFKTVYDESPAEKRKEWGPMTFLPAPSRLANRNGPKRNPRKWQLPSPLAASSSSVNPAKRKRRQESLPTSARARSFMAAAAKQGKAKKKLPQKRRRSPSSSSSLLVSDLILFC